MESNGRRPYWPERYKQWSGLSTPWPPGVAEAAFAEWYYIEARLVIGPVRLSDLGRRLKQRGSKVTHVWMAGMPEWASPEEAQTFLASVREVELARAATTSFFLGMASVAVLRPPGNLLAGLTLPLAATGIYFGTRGLKSSKRTFAVYGLILSAGGPLLLLALALLIWVTQRVG